MPARGAGARLQAELVRRQRVGVAGRRVRAIAQLLVVGGAAGACGHERQREQQAWAHFFFLRAPLAGRPVAGSGAADTSSAPDVSLRSSMARYASPRGSSAPPPPPSAPPPPPPRPS